MQFSTIIKICKYINIFHFATKVKYSEYSNNNIDMKDNFSTENVKTEKEFQTTLTTKLNQLPVCRIKHTENTVNNLERQSRYCSLRHRWCVFVTLCCVYCDIGRRVNLNIHRLPTTPADTATAPTQPPRMVLSDNCTNTTVLTALTNFTLRLCTWQTVAAYNVHVVDSR